jgi:hypothetical protein
MLFRAVSLADRFWLLFFLDLYIYSIKLDMFTTPGF